MTTPEGPTAADGGPNRRIPQRDRLLNDLGGQVRDLATKVAKHWDTLVDLASTVSEFGPQLVDVQRDQGKLAERVELLISTGIKNPPIDWATLTAEDAAREWGALGEWVDVVLPRYYEITRGQLPDCWALHWPAVIHLSWLRTSWVEAHLEHSHPNQVAEWNTRWLDAALDKIKAAIPDTRCRPRHGQPGEHMIDALEAQQRRSRNPQDQHERAQQPHQRVAQPAYTQQPSYGQRASPYSDPAYARGAPGGQQQPAPHQPTPVPAAQTARTGEVRPDEEVIRREYWREFFDQARRADVAWRR